VTALEQTSRIQAIIFDKTGTLTEGAPAVTDLVVFAAGQAPRLDQARLLQMAAAAELDSEHPLARTIVAEAGARGHDRMVHSQRAPHSSDRGNGRRGRLVGVAALKMREDAE
jgi:P-type E1-E2 ATPase